MKRNILIALIFAAITLSGCGEVSMAGTSGGQSQEPASVTTEGTESLPDEDSTPDDPSGKGGEDSSVTDRKPMVIPQWDIIQETVAPDTIVLISRYCNWAWGYQDHGSFITLDGRVYEFDFGDTPEENGKEPPEDLLAALEEIRDSGEPNSQVNGDYIAQCLALGGSIDPNAEMSQEWTACDAGQTTITLVMDGNTTDLSTWGDATGMLKDPCAEELLDILEDNDIMYTGSSWRENTEEGRSLIKDFIDIFR